MTDARLVMVWFSFHSHLSEQIITLAQDSRLQSKSDSLSSSVVLSHRIVFLLCCSLLDERPLRLNRQADIVNEIN